MGIHEKLAAVQAELKAPKSQFNSYGKYSYRSCEDILEAVKPLLQKNGLDLVISDEIVQSGNRYYVRANAVLTDIVDGKSVESVAYAREDETKKGMDLSQVTGSTSSYARKYALNGLFCIDDQKDSDFTNTHGKDKPADKPKKEDKPSDKPKEEKPENDKGAISDAQVKRLYAISKKKGYDAAKIQSMVLSKYMKGIKQLNREEYDHVCAGMEALPDA